MMARLQARHLPFLLLLVAGTALSGQEATTEGQRVIDAGALELLRAASKAQRPEGAELGTGIESLHAKFAVQLFEEDDGTPRKTPRSLEVTWDLLRRRDELLFRREYFDRTEDRKAIALKDARGRHWTLGGPKPLHLESEAHLAKDLEKLKEEISTHDWLLRVLAVGPLAERAARVEMLEPLDREVGSRRRPEMRRIARVRLAFPPEEKRTPLTLWIDAEDHRLWGGFFAPREDGAEGQSFVFRYHTRLEASGWTVPLEIEIREDGRLQAELSARPTDVRINPEMPRGRFRVPR